MSLHLRVLVGREQYAIPIGEVREVDVLAGLTRVPGAGSYVLGVQSRRGELVPVLDLQGLLGIPGGLGTRGVVVEKAGRRAILPVDGAEDVEDLTGDVDGQTGTPLVAGSVLSSDRLIGVLDVGEILDRAAGER